MSPFFFIRMRHLIGISILIAVLIFQLSIIGKVDAGDSEAYYYSWSRNLSPAYYDHPAGIAFLIRLSTSIFGHNTFALRFFSTLFINFSLLIIYLITYLYTNSINAAIFSILFFLTTPAFLIGGVSAAPEPPLVFFCSLSILSFYLYLKNNKTKYLYLSFILTGIGFNIKYSAIFLFINYFLILIREDKIEKKRIFNLLIITITFLMPVVIWNFINKGVSFEYHILRRVDLLYIPLNILKFIGGQLLYFNPITVILMVIIILKQTQNKEYNFFLKSFYTLLILSLIPMILIRDSEPHWSSLIYIIAAILCSKEIQTNYKKLFISGLTLNILLFSIFIFHLFSPTITERLLKTQNPKYDITNELFGWDIVAENIEDIINSEGIPDDKVLLASNHYTMSAQIVFSTRSKYAVVCRGVRCNQFSINDIKDESGFRLFIFITDNRFTNIPKFYKDESVQQKVKIYRGEKVFREFYLYIKKRI